MPNFNSFAYPIGLDISDLSIKLIQLKKTGGKIRIQAMGKISLEPGVLENGEIKNQAELSRAIRSLLSRPSYGKITTNEAAISLPEGKSFLKIIEVDKETEDMEEGVRNELEKHIPLPLEEICYDWQMIGKSDRARLVLVGAAPKNIVAEQLALLKKAGLETAAVEPEQLSVCRALMPEENPKTKTNSKKNYAIIDIGATESSLTVYSKNTIIFSVNMPVAGEKITQKISQVLDISRERAEKIKIHHGLEEEEKEEHPEVKKILSEMIGDLTKKINGAIAFFDHHFSGWGPIEKIFLAGGGANINNLDKVISEETGIETAKADALINFKKGASGLISHFSESFGLNTDFLPEEKNKKNKAKARESKIVKVSQDTSLSYSTAIGLALRGIFIDE
jgi:type IV pilus assembly protein PilM